MGWTIDQEKAIYTDTGDGNILVSAAAGSGKTAVLVERVLQKIISGKSTVDRLLIVTFTEAAASEMRGKIISRLLEYTESEDCTSETRKLLKTQIRLVETADIMTIDAFCMRVVQNNFHTLGIEPQVNICDDAMAKLMAEEALANLYSKIYKSEDTVVLERFGRLTEFYAKDRSNDALSQVILSIRKFIEPFAEPIEWLERAAETFSLPVCEWECVKYYEKSSREVAKKCMESAGHLVNSEDADESLSEIAKKVKNIAEAICDAPNWDGIYAVFKEYFEKPKKRKDFMNLALDLPEYNATKKELIFIMSELCDVFTTGTVPCGITRTSEQTEKLYNRELLQSEAEDIVWIVKEFLAEYEKVKEKHKVYEFSDIEHLAYTLFRDNDAVRERYKNKYDEILIDEYQDTNSLQDNVFELISRNNIFMVGDLKQSIYRFRKGDPYIFKSKSEEYTREDSPHKRINLSQNFRSRQEVLKSVNDVFCRVMSESAGDVEYSGSELIVRDSDYEYYPESETDCRSELHFLPVDKNSGIGRDEAEAKYTAKKIFELLNSGAEVYDKSEKRMRKICKKDIVILENSVKANGDLLTEELSKLGIDTYVDKGSFFDRREISVMLSLISVINNSRQDIPLISVMRSPIGGFSDEDLAKIRINDPKSKNFITAVKNYAKNGEEKKLAARCREFSENIARWRDYTRKKSVSQLIWMIYEDTYFYDIMGALDEGEEAQTNLRLLYERAKQYESAGFKGLFNFTKYISRLEENDAELVGAKLVGENHDVVRIMTIHKSKGLEFPYVFLLGMGKKFGADRDSSRIKLHKKLGMGLPHIYYDKHYSQQTDGFELIATVNKSESVSERMRLLYVALTRAREKLFVSVCVNAKENQTPEEMFLQFTNKMIGGKMKPSTALDAKGFFDWLCPAAYASPNSWEVKYPTVQENVEETALEQEAENFEDTEALRESVYKILDYEYPYKESDVIPSRTSVTALKELSAERDEEVYEPDSRRISGEDSIAERMFSPLHQKPKFMQEIGEKRANEIGTLYHLVMSEIDLNAVALGGAEAVENEIARFEREGILSADDLKYIDVNKIKTFFESDIAKRILKSKNVNREKSFQIKISAREYDPSLSEKYEDEAVILQGIIDCYFEEKDGFVLLDYKTDKVGNAAEIRKKYDKQLVLYREAIERITGKPVKESFLYLFDSGETV